MAFSAKAVANRFLELAKDADRSLDPMQVQKLVYFAHGWHLAICDEPLIKEHIEAWPYGPVVPTLFHEFKQWGSGHIGKPALREAHGFSSWISHEPASLEQESTFANVLEAAKDVIDRVWEVYGAYSGVQLSNLTHQPDTPWTEARRLNPGGRDVLIENESLKRYFKARLEKNATPAPESVV